MNKSTGSIRIVGRNRSRISTRKSQAPREKFGFAKAIEEMDKNQD